MQDFKNAHTTRTKEGRNEEMKGTIINYMGCEFAVGYSKTFDRDLETVRAILDKGIENLTKADRIRLLMIYR